MKEDVFVKNEAECIKLTKTSKVEQCDMSPVHTIDNLWMEFHSTSSDRIAMSRKIRCDENSKIYEIPFIFFFIVKI